jgi:hypothetical protein
MQTCKEKTQWSASVMLKMPNSNKLSLKEMQAHRGNADTNSEKNSEVKCKHSKKKHRYTISKWWEKP